MPPTSNLFTTSRVLAYSAISTSAAVTVVYNAFRDRPNFYSAMVGLGRSNGNVGILLNFGLLVTFVAGRLLQLFFFGNLRRVEIEHLWERTWYSVTDSLFAMTIFRDQFDAGFVILFVALLFVKVFHWLGGDRVELMQQTPSLPRFFHLRMGMILASLYLVDFISILFFVEFLITEKDRSGLTIMFASEFMILFCTLNNTLAKYLINCYDLRREEPWEQKSMWVSTADLITDFCKLLTYLIFFSLIFSYYGLPLNIVRDVWMTGRSFFGRIRDLVRYRAATKNMDERYPNASAEELGRTDGTCIICREEMVIHGAANPTPPTGNPQADQAAQPPAPTQPNNPTSSTPSSGLNETPKKLPCGHIFHFYCLRSWLERQQSCPTCRRTVLDANGRPVNQPPNAVPGATPAQPGRAAATGTGTETAAAGRTATPATAGGNGGANATASAAQRVGQFARQLETQAQRQRELELEGRGGTAGPSTAAPTQASSSTPLQPSSSTSTANPATTASSSVPRGAARPTTTSAQPGVPRSLISAVFADPAVPGQPPTQVSSSTSRADPLSSVPAFIAGSGRPGGAQWGSGYAAQNPHSSTQAVSSAPPGYGYHQSYPNRQNQVHHGLPLPNGGQGGSRWTPPRPSSLSSPAVQPSPRAVQPTPDSASTSTPAASTGTAPVAPAASTTTVVPTAPSEAAFEEPSDPREAARAAALKRFSALSKSTTSTPKAEASKDNLEMPSTEAAPPAGVEEKASTSVTPGDPHLIPLFDPKIVPDYQALHGSSLPYPLVSPSQAPPIVPAPSNGFDLSSFSSRLHSTSTPSNGANGSGVPNRESLEESLRALVAVQENVWKAIEEVTRIVSTLPSSSSSQVEIGSTPSSNRSESLVGGESESPKSKHLDSKGKQAAEGVNAPGSSSSKSNSPPPPTTRSIPPTLTPPTKSQNPWSNEQFSSSALSSGNSTPAIEHSQSSLFSSNPIPRSFSPSRVGGTRDNLSSTSGVVVDELDMTEEQRNQEVNNMVAGNKPRRRVSFASRDDHIPSEEKETSEESESGNNQAQEISSILVNGYGDGHEEASIDQEIETNDDVLTSNVNGIQTEDQSSGDETATEMETPRINGIGLEGAEHQEEEVSETPDVPQVEDEVVRVDENGIGETIERNTSPMLDR